MREHEERLSDPEEQKEKIRSRYQGIDTALLDVIPARCENYFDGNAAEKRVGVYARVSTDDPRQTSSYELQKNHYQDMVRRHDGWRLAEIYADEGISGTSLKHRDAFLRMIADCRCGKLDLIVTKSVSRFARNVVDCIQYVRELKALKPPVGVFFETENIFTLNPDSEMSLSFLSTLAQEESHNKSEIMNASVEMRFKRGIFLTPPLLGYDQDADGNLVINEDEAKTVRLIFFLYLYGRSCSQIASILEKLGRPTKKGRLVWSDSSVLRILQNERHCGDVLARKTWTPSYLDHRSKKNVFDRNQYLQKNHHPAIISRGDFIAAQKRISNARYGGSGFLPQLCVISAGILRGYVSVNPRWSGFSCGDYRLASQSAGAAEESPRPGEAAAPAGSFDLRGYETVRARFFCMADLPVLIFRDSQLRFNAVSVRCFSDDITHVELLFHPHRLALAVRPARNSQKNAVQWASVKASARITSPASRHGDSGTLSGQHGDSGTPDGLSKDSGTLHGLSKDSGTLSGQHGDAAALAGQHGDAAAPASRSGNADTLHGSQSARIVPRPVAGSAFLPVLYSLCGWQPGQTYRAAGTLCKKEDEAFLLFDLREAEVLPPAAAAQPQGEPPAASAARGFGESYYRNRHRETALAREEWESRRPAVRHGTPDPGISSRRELRAQIGGLLLSLRPGRGGNRDARDGFGENG